MVAQLQYFSDVHTEFFITSKSLKQLCAGVQANAPYLLLGGDIGFPFSDTYMSFIADMSSKFIRVFVVAGNHEYYCTNHGAKQAHRSMCFTDDVTTWMQVVNDQIRSVCSAFPNVIFLNNEVNHITDRVMIFGGTLWTDIPPAIEGAVAARVNDYTMIPGLTTSTTRHLHKCALQALRTSMEAFPEKNIIVLSHHLPSTRLISAVYTGNILNCAYASDVQEAGDERILAWFAGHTHTPVELEKFHVNPIGYKAEISTRGDFNKTIEIKGCEF